jgi:hypothetical protein
VQLERNVSIFTYHFEDKREKRREKKEREREKKRE